MSLEQFKSISNTVCVNLRLKNILDDDVTLISGDFLHPYNVFSKTDNMDVLKQKKYATLGKGVCLSYFLNKFDFYCFRCSLFNRYCF